MTSSEPPEREAQLMARAITLRLDAAAAELFSRFEAGGVKSLLLKGPAIAQWLYVDSAPRLYADCDFLVAPEDFANAEGILASLGYDRHFDDQRMPGWWREHATAWLRQGDQVTVDLHRRIVGIGASEADAWHLLSADAEVVLVHQRQVAALALPARALHVALHAAQHGTRWERGRQDLERALSTCSDDLWQAAAQLAVQLNAIDAFVAGLGVSDAGRRLADRLRLGAVRSVDARLRASSAPPHALGFEQLARARGMRARVEILWRKTVPPADFIRHWDPSASRSQMALLAAYARRPFWLISRAPGAWRAWRRARRSVL